MRADRQQISVRGLTLRARRAARSWLSGCGRERDILQDGLIGDLLVQIVVFGFQLLDGLLAGLP